jgi:tRNA (guanine-N7-)-methyltransferase
MDDTQRRAWEAYRDRWVLDVPHADLSTSVAPDTAPLELPDVFGRPAPLIVEIGPGSGDSLVPMAQDRPEANILAFEVFEPAIASMLARLARARVTNVRIVPVDAVDGLTHLVTDASIEQLWTFFPDPWHKSRHRKRRLLSPRFADLVADKMVPGGRWRLATDWADYARHIRGVLDDHDRFVNHDPQGLARRWESRPVTRFEQRGLDAGRHIVDLCYERTS